MFQINDKPTSSNMKRQDPGIPKKVNQDSPKLKMLDPFTVKDSEVKKIIDEDRKVALQKEISSYNKYLTRIQLSEKEMYDFHKHLLDDLKTNIPKPKKEIIKPLINDNDLKVYYDKLNKIDEENHKKREIERLQIMKSYNENLKEQMKIKRDAVKSKNSRISSEIGTSLKMNGEEDWIKRRTKIQEDIKKSLQNQMNKEVKPKHYYASVKVLNPAI